MKTLFIILVMVLLGTPAVAGTCTKTSEVCTDNSTRTVSGTAVTKCWNYRSVYSCASDTYTDYCTPIASTPGCTQTGSVCTKTNSSGTCDTYEDTYTCGNQFTATENIIYLSSSYTISNDSLDKSQCQSLDSNPACELAGQVCTQGAATRNINGLDVYKDCWEYEYQYTCLGDVDYNDCSALDKNCTYQSKQCIAKDSNGSCMNYERYYECSKTTTTAASMVCQGQIYCINGDCQQPATTPDTGIAKGLTYMGLVQKAGEEFSSDNMTVFAGNGKTCHKDIAGFNNCCSDDGWGQDIGLASCGSDEQSLATLGANGQCHYVGTYCSSQTFFGTCTEKKKAYCCFNSKLSRIIQEQARTQSGISWGSAGAPDCDGLTIEQLQSLDFTTIDLSEIFPDVSAGVSVPESKAVVEGVSEKIQGYYGQ